MLPLRAGLTSSTPNYFLEAIQFRSYFIKINHKNPAKEHNNGGDLQ
jgi:hypothetical protein